MRCKCGYVPDSVEDFDAHLIQTARAGEYEHYNVERRTFLLLLFAHDLTSQLPDRAAWCQARCLDEGYMFLSRNTVRSGVGSPSGRTSGGLNRGTARKTGA